MSTPEQAPAPPTPKRQYVNFVFYKVDPAWRRLERLLEEKHTAELTSDFEDYEIGDEGEGPGKGQRKPRN